MANKMAPFKKIIEISLGILLVLVLNVQTTDVKGKSLPVGIGLRLSGSDNPLEGMVKLMLLYAAILYYKNIYTKPRVQPFKIYYCS